MTRHLSLLFTVFGTTVAAQWLNYSTPGIPRNADGKPNLSAPTPRTADGRPDLSGIWAAAERHHQLAMEVPGGAPFTEWSRTIREARLKNGGRDIPTSRCLPSGIPPDMLRPPQPFRVIQTAGMIAILLEEFSNWRQIFIDGRPLPVDPEPAWFGYSVGKWEGGTLVIESAGFNDKTWLDGAGTPHSDALRLTERFTRPNFGHMEIEYTLNDPKTFTRPWSVAVKFNLQADTELLDSHCENEKDVVHFR